LLKTIGEGGNAKVKLAFDIDNQTKVAIKIMREYDENTKNMVLQEAQVMCNVKHLNVLQVIKYGEGPVEKANKKGGKYLYIAL